MGGLDFRFDRPNTRLDRIVASADIPILTQAKAEYAKLQ
jgi:hypothetical protein